MGGFALSANNQAFWRALHSLAHPVSIGAVVLLLVNDHWMRHQYPSWLTGKLGDFTWLMFAPFIAAVVFAWIIPRRIQRHERIVGLLSIGFIGLWFALAKTIPAVHHLTKAAWDAVVGWEGTLRLDPTDLLTLPALLLSGWVWQRVDNHPVSLRPLAYAVLGLGLVATLASSEYMTSDFGIGAFCEQYDGRLYMKRGDSSVWVDFFFSDDGGLTWALDDSLSYPSHPPLFPEPTPSPPATPSKYPRCSQASFPIVNPNSPNIWYRWESGKQIDISTDYGVNWETGFTFDINLMAGKQFHQIVEKPADDIVVYSPGPLSGLVHSQTGNAIFAMGWDGLLVHKVNGDWQWVAVKHFGLPDLTQPQALLPVFQLEILGALMLFFLILETVVVSVYDAVPSAWVLFIAVWLFWLGFVSVVLPAHHTGNDSLIMEYFCVAPPFIFIVIVGINAIWRLWRMSVLKLVLMVTVGILGLYCFPFLLWLRNTIPNHSTASFFSAFLTLAGLFAGYRYLKPQLPVLEKEKSNDKDNATILGDE